MGKLRHSGRDRTEGLGVCRVAPCPWSGCGLLNAFLFPVLIYFLCFLPCCRNVEDVCRFPDLPARRQLTYQAKQLIAREIELEKMRRTEALLQARNRGEVGRIPRFRGPSMGVKSSGLLWGPGVSEAAGGFRSADGNPGLTPACLHICLR